MKTIFGNLVLAAIVLAVIAFFAAPARLATTFFAAGAAKRAAAEAGLSSAVTEREADDLVRDVGTFLAVVENCLGVSARSAYPRPRIVGGTSSERSR